MVIVAGQFGVGDMAVAVAAGGAGVSVPNIMRSDVDECARDARSVGVGVGIAIGTETFAVADTAKGMLVSVAV